MLLKIEHMFWNLKKHGMQADFYIGQKSSFCKKYVIAVLVRSRGTPTAICPQIYTNDYRV
jgi:hypothetical protein